MSLSEGKLISGLSSSRVKCLDFHENNQLLLAALFSGEALVVDALSGSLLKTIAFHPGSALRTGRWMPNSNIFAVGGDKGCIYFYNYVKSTIILTVENAHSQIVRSISFHKTDPLMLTCGEDKLIKLWDISNGKCELIRTYKGHKQLIMDVKWSLREPTTFGSASYDGTVMFWEVSQEKPRFTQTVSNKCINCISFASIGVKSLFAASADDSFTYIIDMQTRQVVAKLEGHTGNVSRVEFHPQRPLIFTCSEDTTALAYSLTTFAKEKAYPSNYKRIWAMAISTCYPLIAFGCDQGLFIYKFKNKVTPMSLDSTGKHFVVAHINDVQTAPIKDLKDITDGQEPNLSLKDIFTSEFLPEQITHSPNGKFIAFVGEGEYSIYSSLGFKAKTFGKAMKVVWCSTNSNIYAILTHNRYCEIHYSLSGTQNSTPSPTSSKGADDGDTFRLEMFATKIYGGLLLGVQCQGRLSFVDWESHEVIRMIEVNAKEVAWYDNKVAIRTKESIFVLEFNEDYENFESAQTGYEDSFSVLYEYPIKATSIFWASGILLFTEGCNLKRFVSESILPISTSSKPITIVGYSPRENCVLCADSQRKLCAFILPQSLLEFERIVLDESDADPSLVPPKYRTREAKLMKSLGHPELAIEVADDNATKFEISMELKNIDDCERYATDPQQFQRLSKLCLEEGNIETAIRCLKQSNDLATLLLIYKAQGMKEELKDLVNIAEESKQLNVAFSAALLSNQKEKCVDLLLKSKKYPEACLFARSNCPQLLNDCTKQWKANAISKRVSEELADPEEFPQLFE